MKRSPAYDPPEYVSWTPDPNVLGEFCQVLDRDPDRQAVLRGLSVGDFRRLYQGMVRNRLHDVTLNRWVRTGTLTKAWLGTGEEAVTIGAVTALRKGDVVAPMIRNAGAAHEMGMPLADLFRAYLATEDGPTRGRDLHTGDMNYGVIAPISHVGAVLPVAVGVAMGFRLKKVPQVAMTWVGDGSSKTGDFHEGCNLAAVQRAPIVIILQNNQVALGTALQQHHVGRFEGYGAVYGMASATVDGNNVLDVFAGCHLAVERARQGGGPTLVVAETFRMGGHATHDEREARDTFSPHLFSHWGARDPIGTFEHYLTACQNIDPDQLIEWEQEVMVGIEAAEREALESRLHSPPQGERVSEGVYARPIG